MRIKVIPYNTEEYVSQSAFPQSGESGKHYLALDNMYLYVWNGTTSQYSRVSFRYEGKPTYHGSYLKSGYLEFTIASSPTPIEWHNGDYIRYSRTSRVYKLYGIPQVERQASTDRSGESFAYRNVQFYDNIKALELVPFRDYVPGTNQYFFSSRQDVAFTGTVANVAERLNAVLADFFGSGVWNVRIADNIPASYEITEAKDYNVSGSCLDALNAIYETWHELGWAFAVENGVNTVILGYPNVNPDTSGNHTNVFSYGNGLTALKRNNGSLNDFCTRMHVFGTERNLINRYYNGKDIHNAESVYIPNLMIPLEYWGTTDSKPDASKAYLEDADKIAEFGLITKDVYFDGTDGRPEVFPSIEEQTIEILKAAKETLGKTEAGAPDYYPQEDDDTIRVDQIKDIISMPQDNGNVTSSGNRYIDTCDAEIDDTLVDAEEHTAALSHLTLLEYTFDDSGIAEVNFNGSLQFTINQDLGERDYLTLKLQVFKDAIGRNPLASADFDEVEAVTHGMLFNLKKTLTVGTKDNPFTGKLIVTLTYAPSLKGTRGGTNSWPVTIVKEGDVTLSAGLKEAMVSTFKIKTHQIGFDISKMTSVGGATLSMKSGMCAGREFPITRVVYNEDDDSWTLTCRRIQDSSTSAYYPNSAFTINEDEKFVILGIEMPEEYVLAQAQRLYTLGQALFEKVSVIKPSFEPSIDSKKVLKNIEDNPNSAQYILLEGKYMCLYDTDLIGGDHNASVLISELTISEGDAEIATYRVVLSDTGSVSAGVMRTLANINNNLQQIQSEQHEAQVKQSQSLLDTGSNNVPVYIEGGQPKEVDGIDLPGEGHFEKGLRVGRYSSRLPGAGAHIDEDGNAEFESIYSRNFISTPEFRFNRVAVTEGENWCTNGFGTIDNVEITDATHGKITLKLEENDFATIQPGDLCRGIYNDLDNEYDTDNLDDDSSLYGEGSASGFGFSCKTGFFTSYFKVMQFIENVQGKCTFTYELRNSSTPHPCQFMKFAQYGNTDSSSGRCSSRYETSIGHFREMILDGVTTWKIQSANVVACFGWLEGLSIVQNNRDPQALHGYGLYAQDNVYFGSAVVQLDPQSLADLQAQVRNYTADFSEHVEVITVDDVGNVIGGLVTVDDDVETYRIHTAVSVRKNGTLLVLADDGDDADTGTYKISVLGRNCTAMVIGSDIYITAIDNLNDGQSGTTISDYDAMRAMEKCSVDVTIDCEGLATLNKSFDISIKHDSQPFVNADLGNDTSAVSYVKGSGGYEFVGLPILVPLNMWHNNEVLPIDGIGITINNGSDDVTKEYQRVIDGSDVSFETTDSVTLPYATVSFDTETIGGVVQPVLKITALANAIPDVLNVKITMTATYAGVSYERTLTHTINKSKDIDIYQLDLPVRNISASYNSQGQLVLGQNTVYCKVVLQSTIEDGQIELDLAAQAARKLYLTYQKYKRDGGGEAADGNETAYTASGVSISITSTVTPKRVLFKLYELNTLTSDMTHAQKVASGNVKRVWETEDVHILCDGAKGEQGSTGPTGNGISSQTAYYKKTATPEPPSTDNLDENHGWYESDDSGWPIEGDNEKPYLWECVHTTYTNGSSNDFLKLVSVYNISVQPNLLKDTGFVSEDNMTAWDSAVLNGELVPGSVNSWGCKPMDGGQDNYNNMLRQVIWNPNGIKNIKPGKWYTLSFYSRTRKYVNLTSDRNAQGFGYETIYLRAGTYKLQVNGRISSAASSGGVILRGFVFGPQQDGQDSWDNNQIITISDTIDTTAESGNLVVGTDGVYKIGFQAYKNDGSANSQDVTVNWWRIKCVTDDSTFTTHIYPGVVDTSVYYKDRIKYTNALTNADLYWKSDEDTPDNDGWTFHSCTFKMKSTWTSDNKTVLFRVQRVYLEIKCPKFEESIISTDWVPNESDVGNECAIVPAGTWVSGAAYYYYGGVRNAVRVSGSNQWYILKRRTGKNGFTSTVSPASDPANWQPSSYMKFIACDAMFAEDVVADRMRVGRLSSIGSNGVEVNIGDGMLQFKGLNFVNIQLGLDEDGCAILKFFDKNGVFQYDLGPNGINQNVEQQDNSFLSYTRLVELEDEAYSRQSVWHVHQLVPTSWYQFVEGYTQTGNVRTYNVSGTSTPSAVNGTICDSNAITGAVLDWIASHRIAEGIYVGRELEIGVNDSVPGASYYTRRVYSVRGLSGKPVAVGNISYMIGEHSNWLFCEQDGTPISTSGKTSVFDFIEFYN